MTVQEINKAMAELSMRAAQLEEEFENNGGEVTDFTESLTSDCNEIADLLEGEGIDSLGRWLKAKEDEKKALKNEKDYITRKMASVDNTIEFVKGKIREVMDMTGADKVKGNFGYSFARTTSTTTSIEKNYLNQRYGNLVEAFRIYYRIPKYITLTLGASAALAKDGDVEKADQPIFHVDEKETVRFTKPRGTKEE